MLADILKLLRFPTADKLDRVAKAFRVDLYELDLLALYALRAEMPL